MSSLISRNVVVNAQRTSFRLEPEIWEMLDIICTQEQTDIHTLCSWVSTLRPRSNRTSAIRAFVVTYLRAHLDKAPFEAGHNSHCLCRTDKTMSQTLCFLFKES